MENDLEAVVRLLTLRETAELLCFSANSAAHDRTQETARFQSRSPVARP